MSDLLQLLVILVSSFAGTIGFACLLHAPMKTVFPASIIGGIAYTLYYFLTLQSVPEAAAMFAGTLCGTLLGQACARKMRCISTIFTTLSIVPMVPGLGLFRCMELLARNETDEGLAAGIGAMTAIAMIALGMAVGTYLFRVFAGSRKQQLLDR